MNITDYPRLEVGDKVMCPIERLPGVVESARDVNPERFNAVQWVRVRFLPNHKLIISAEGASHGFVPA
ncbi:hypothetical protein [Paenibacillus abyssi]|uniref:Uncharacterized protein n=1 Tax=Paenibacillus abyssi TaxID=1340531 RepID=A0A917G1A3_9BACL|nr:hypothetical protein [Paenibacillus abyssi]GGG17889.1 hypothetical protein GCM10010916_38370 [Paenibacillus abyssi]